MLPDVAAAGFALLLLWAGLAKLRRRWYFVAAVRSWGISSQKKARLVGWLVPAVEIGIALVLLTSLGVENLRWPARAALVTLLASFTLGQLLLLARGKGAYCGCGGRTIRRIGLLSIARTGTLTALAAAVAMAA